MAASAAVITRSTFTASERMKLQLEKIRDQKYRKIGKLTTIVIERQMPTAGMSQSKPRWSNPEQAKIHARDGNFDVPFSEWQLNAWVNMTLDYLHPSNGPVLAISDDRNDLLLPFGLAPLPKIPDPFWVPGAVRRGLHAGETAPRIEQKLESRACGRIRARDGRMWLIFQPLTEICVCIGGKAGGFGRIVCKTDPADHTHSALLVDPNPVDRDGNMEAHFIGGSFQAGW
jgi:hypothetical protein